jgi:hypothetical protein
MRPIAAREIAARGEAMATTGATRRYIGAGAAEKPPRREIDGCVRAHGNQPVRWTTGRRSRRDGERLALTLQGGRHVARNDAKRTKSPFIYTTLLRLITRSLIMLAKRPRARPDGSRRQREVCPRWLRGLLSTSPAASRGREGIHATHSALRDVGRVLAGGQSRPGATGDHDADPDHRSQLPRPRRHCRDLRRHGIRRRRRP